jgi:general secretion pathway protein G
MRTAFSRKIRAFTLLEIVLIAALVLLVVSLATMRVPSSRPATLRAKDQITRLRQALEQYRQDIGSYPAGANGLLALMHQTGGSTNWHGPYTYNVPKDPWGHEYVYRFPSQDTNAEREYDLFSPGVPAKNSPIGR